jgi:hypothetical protein
MFSKDEGTTGLEMWVTVYQLTQQNIPEGVNLQCRFY